MGPVKGRDEAKRTIEGDDVSEWKKKGKQRSHCPKGLKGLEKKKTEQT